MLIVGTETYADLDTLIAILLDHGYEAFIQATPPDRLEALARKATVYLDHAYEYAGARTDPGQALEWPRTGCVDQAGVAIASDAIPGEVVTAEALLVYYASFGDLAGSTGGSDRAVQSESADDATITYAPGSDRRRFPLVGALLRHLIVANRMGTFRQVATARG